MAVDTVTTGNSVRSVGPVESCREVRRGDSLEIDLVVRDAPPLTGFQVRLAFDPKVVEIRGRESDFLLGSGGLEAGDVRFPVSTSPWLYGYTNFPPQSGSGVLLRLAVTVIGKGVSPLALRSGPLGTILVDSDQDYVPLQSLVSGELRANGERCPPPVRPGGDTSDSSQGSTSTNGSTDAAVEGGTGYGGLVGAGGNLADPGTEDVHRNDTREDVSGDGANGAGEPAPPTGDSNPQESVSRAVTASLIVGPVIMAVAVGLAYVYRRRHSRGGVDAE